MKLVVFVTDYILERAASFTLFSETQFCFMADFVSQMQFLNRIIKIMFACIILLSHLFMLDSQCTVLKV